MPYCNMFIEIDFTDGIVINNLIIKEVSINVKELMKPNLTAS